MAAPPEERDVCIVVCFEDARRERFVVVRHRSRGWELPGGRLEPNEDPERGALREFAEETGRRLEAPVCLLRQNRPHGAAWIFVGHWGPPVEVARGAAEPTQEVRFVRRLGDVAPLAFPDDPYEEIEAVLGRRLR